MGILDFARKDWKIILGSKLKISKLINTP